MKYKVREYCGAHLDPGEHCDCRKDTGGSGDAGMTAEQVLRYTALMDRRMQIIMNSGVNWLPQYEQEMEDIDREIGELRQVIDAEHKRRKGGRQ